MPERSTVFQRSQLGVETVFGTSVATTKKLLLTSIMPKARVPMSEFRPIGNKYNVDQTKQKEWSEASYDGIVNFTDIIYILSSLIKTTTPTGTPALWTFMQDPFGPDTYKSYTLEFGSSVQAEKAVGAVFNSLEMVFTGEECTYSGDIIAQEMTEGITLTAGNTDVTRAPIDPSNTDIFIGATVGGLTRITRALEARVALRNVHGRLVTLDSTEPSHSALTDLAPELTASLTVAHDSVAAGYMANLRARDTRFMRIKNTGGSYGASTYDLQITFPFKFREPDRADNQGVLGSTFDLLPIYDSTFATAIEFVVGNGIATL